MTEPTEPPALPALTYHGTKNIDGSYGVYPIDFAVPTDPRERAICRALLQHALTLLDATDLGLTAERAR
ncbi:hypothetical protein ACTVZO_05320 [Streptomyces sp. IBSNAI002]|uniref:hypothetical protein n=1 Tax=Streptomyces sp. IBSNAI002 TaxID=3457500 RepID=UPI003FD618D4